MYCSSYITVAQEEDIFFWTEFELNEESGSSSNYRGYASIEVYAALTGSWSQLELSEGLN